MDAYYTIDDGSVATDVAYEMEFTADATKYLSLPVRGTYLRFKIEHGGSVTPTLIATLRNN